MTMTNQEIIDDLATTRNIKQSTKRRYGQILEKYSAFCNMTLEELLDEADYEEEQRIRQKKRKIKKRLTDFQTYLYTNYLKATAKGYFDVVMTFYHHYEIEIPQIPQINQKNVLENPPLKYSDLLTKDILRRAVDKSDPLMRALILFSISSGCANAETMSLTIQSFIDATSNPASPYHNSNDIYEIIDLLIDRDDVVPTFYLKRRKTNKYYYTFCSPEATHATIVYLSNSRRKLVPEDKLFRIHPNVYARKLVELNEDLGLGKKGTYNRLRTHQFRKFHASNLKKDGMSMDDINSIQGKGKSTVNEPYFFDSPEQLKETYMSHLSAVTLDWNVRNLDMKSREFLLLEKELKNKNIEYDFLKNRVKSIEEAITGSVSEDEINIMKRYI